MVKYIGSSKTAKVELIALLSTIMNIIEIKSHEL